MLMRLITILYGTFLHMCYTHIYIFIFIVCDSFTILIIHNQSKNIIITTAFIYNLEIINTYVRLRFRIYLNYNDNI